MYHLIFQLNIQLNATQGNVAGKTIDSVRFFEWGLSRLNETTKQYGTLRQICWAAWNLTWNTFILQPTPLQEWSHVNVAILPCFWKLREGKRESVIIGVHITFRIPTIVISAVRMYRLVKRYAEIETTTCRSRLIHTETVNGWNGRAVKQGSAHPPPAIRRTYALRRPSNIACNTWCTRRHWRWVTHIATEWIKHRRWR